MVTPVEIVINCGEFFRYFTFPFSAKLHSSVLNYPQLNNGQCWGRCRRNWGIVWWVGLFKVYIDLFMYKYRYTLSGALYRKTIELCCSVLYLCFSAHPSIHLYPNAGHLFFRDNLLPSTHSFPAGFGPLKAGTNYGHVAIILLYIFPFYCYLSYHHDDEFISEYSPSQLTVHPDVSSHQYS